MKRLLAIAAIAGFAWKRYGNPWWRIKLLITRESKWTEADGTEVVEVHDESWRTAWALAGWHSYNWWWVRKFGQQACGCLYNPLTGNKTIFCSQHLWESLGFPGDWLDFVDDGTD